MGLLDKVHLELLLWIVCLSRLFIKLYLWIFCLLILLMKLYLWIVCLLIQKFSENQEIAPIIFMHTCNANWYVPQWLFDAFYWRKIYSKTKSSIAKQAHQTNKHLQLRNKLFKSFAAAISRGQICRILLGKSFHCLYFNKNTFCPQKKTLHFCRRPAAWAVESGWDWSLQKDPATWSILSDLWTSWLR